MIKMWGKYFKKEVKHAPQKGTRKCKKVSDACVPCTDPCKDGKNEPNKDRSIDATCESWPLANDEVTNLKKEKYTKPRRRTKQILLPPPGTKSTKKKSKQDKKNVPKEGKTVCKDTEGKIVCKDVEGEFISKDTQEKYLCKDTEQIGSPLCDPRCKNIFTQSKTRTMSEITMSLKNNCCACCEQVVLCLGCILSFLRECREDNDPSISDILFRIMEIVKCLGKDFIAFLGQIVKCVFNF